MRLRSIVIMVSAALALGAGRAYAQGTAAAAKPDFSGIWQALNTAAWNVEDHSASPGVPAGQGVVDGGTIPYLPAALATRDENFKNRATADPESKCYLLGVPRIMYAGFPFQIIQKPDQLTMLFEYAHATRYVYTNGTPHPKGHIDWWMGDSRGHWDGNTLVVDSIDFGPETWLDRAGNFHSDALHVVERFTLLDADHINYEATLEDPKVYARPWKMSMIFYRHREKNFQLLEYECYSFDSEKYYPYPELNR